MLWPQSILNQKIRKVISQLKFLKNEYAKNNILIKFITFMGVCTSHSQKQRKIKEEEKNDTIQQNKNSNNETLKGNLENAYKLSKSPSSQFSHQGIQKQKIDMSMILDIARRKRGSVQTEKKSQYSQEKSEYSNKNRSNKKTFKVNIALKQVPLQQCYEILSQNGNNIQLSHLITKKLRVGILYENNPQSKELIQQILELQLFHPRLQNIIEILEFDNQILIVKEHFEHKDLRTSHIENQTEILKQIIEAIEYLHQKNIIHGYLNIESFQKCATIDKIKLIDIEKVLSKPKHREEEIQYFSPEACNKGNIYTKQRDCWAIGIIGLELFAKQHLFHGNSFELIQQDILTNNQIIIQTILHKIENVQLSELLQLLLNSQQKSRISLQKASAHICFQSKQLISKKRLSQIIKKVFELKKKSCIYQCLALFILRNINIEFNEDRESQLFYEMDISNDGKVCKIELMEFMKKNKYTEEEIVNCFIEIEKCNDGICFDYNEYITSLFETSTFLNEDQLQEAFSQLTYSNQGITLGKMISLFPHREDELKLDFNQFYDKIITYPTFKQIMCN
ncbi:unnamed protein product [Paramecium sonneborni]|uniref:Protein kinase domain-containing protein n=1 Tax=Paramecium sonneborni TaxID=65129 RepID=A0A8S1QVI3_9CILI|nr:unnamed protein product [Paramecium sonneborni]